MCNKTSIFGSIFFASFCVILFPGSEDEPSSPIFKLDGAFSNGGTQRSNFWREIPCTVVPDPAADIPLPMFTTSVEHALRENRSEDVWDQVHFHVLHRISFSKSGWKYSGSRLTRSRFVKLNVIFTDARPNVHLLHNFLRGQALQQEIIQSTRSSHGWQVSKY